jgi:microcystin-dependent protein
MSNYNFAPTLDGLNNIDGNNINSNTLITDYLTVNLASSVPTVAPATNDNSIASTAYVTTAISNSGSNYVDLTSIQNIIGEKTFSNANTIVSGNLITNSIQSSNPVNNINIGTQLTTGDINLGNVFIGPTMNVALNWGTSSNGGILSLYGGSFNLISSGIYTQRSGPTFGMTMGDTQSTGIMNIANRGDRSGAININTGGTSTAPINISSLTTNNAPITIGSTSSTTQTCAMNAMTNFSKIVTCPIAPVNANDLCNKTYVDSLAPSGYVDLTTAQTVGGAKTFTSNIIAGAGIIPTSGTNLTLTTTGGEDVVINGSNDITFNSSFNTTFNAGAYGSFQAGVGYTFVCNGGYGFKFIDNAIGGGFESTTSNNIVNTSVNNIDYNSASVFGTYYNGPIRGAIYDNTAYNVPIITFQNGQATDIGVTFNALNVFVPIGNTCNMVRVSIPFDLLAWATFGLPLGSGTIGLRFDSFSVVYLKNGSPFTPFRSEATSSAIGVTRNWAKSGTQTNVQGLSSYFGNLDIAFDIAINNTSVDTYQVRVNPQATITNYSINFDNFKFVCRNATGGQTNGNGFTTTSITAFTGGSLVYGGGNPAFVDTSVSKLGLSYPVPPTTASCYMPLNNNITPAGMISMYAGSIAPAGWLLCNGGSRNIVDYPNLYAVIGNMYGGSLGAGTFSVPDTRGIFVRGTGSQTLDGDTYTGTLGQKQGHVLENHLHTYSDSHFYDDANSGQPNGSTAAGCLSGTQYQTPTGDSTGMNADEQFQNRLTKGTFLSTATQVNQATAPTSGGLTGTETFPANISFNYIIKY